MPKCLNCPKEFEKNDPRQKFCSRHCSVSFNNLRRKLSDQAKLNIKNGVNRYWETHKEQHVINGCNSQKGKHRQVVTSILDLSVRTAHKILKRIKSGCSNCGWNKTSCDIHHIMGRKIEKAHAHSNLCLLCPNCHRLVHEKKLSTDKLKSLDNTLPKNWLEFYYG